MELERIPWPSGAAVDEDDLQGRLQAEGFSVWRWSDAPGADYEPHTHDRDECIWIIAGEITFTAGERRLRLGSGDRLMLPKGTVHTARAGSTGATYLVGEKS